MPVILLDKGGRIVVPANIRKALDLRSGDKGVFRLEDGSVRLIPLKHSVLMAQQSIRRYVPEGTSLVDALLQARREEG